MSASGNGIKGVVGGMVILALVGARVYLRATRNEDRRERHAAQDAAFEADHAQWKTRALLLMSGAPGSKGATDKGIGEYLAWGVDTYHAEAEEETMDSFAPSGAEYRDALITKIFDRARQDGREEITRSLEKLRTMVQLSDPGRWWIVEKKK